VRILHVADLHQGLVTHSRPDPKTGLPSALLNVAKCWKRVVEIAREQRVNALIVAGDVFHDRDPSADSIALFAEGLQELDADEIPVLIIAGNHDRAPHPGRRSVLEAFNSRRGMFEDVVVSVKPELVQVGDLTVATLPSVSRHQLMADDWSRSRVQADEDLVDGLCRILGMFRTQEVDVLVGHWPVQGAILGNEKDIAIVPEPVIPLAELEGPWQYVALGHIHKAQPIGIRGEEQVACAGCGGSGELGRVTADMSRDGYGDTRAEGQPIPCSSCDGYGWMVGEAYRALGAYAGSVDRLNFGEEKEPKVCLEVEIGAPGRQTSVTEHELPARRFHTIEVLEDGSDYLGYEGHAEGAIVRVVNCPPSQEAEWRRALTDAGAELIYIHTRQEKQERRRAANVTEALTPLDALDQFLDIRGVAESDRPGIRTLGKQLIEEVRP